MRQYLNCSFFVLLCFIFGSLDANAQAVKVSAKLDKTSILLGDQTVLRLSATLPDNQHINFPVLQDTISSKIHIVEEGKADTVSDKNNPGIKTISRQYIITAFDAGVQTVPAFAFETPGGILKTDPLPLQVQEVKVDTSKAIFDIKQPMAVSYGLTDWLRDNWYWVAGVVLILAVLAGLWYYFRKRKKPEPVIVEEVKPLIPLHIVALEKLRALQEKKLWQQGELKGYHSELTDIIREYLEKKYHINAMEQTSEEILSGLKHMEISELNRNRLRQVLILADLVKFAKATPLNTDNEQSMDHAMGFVNGTV